MKRLLLIVGVFAFLFPLVVHGQVVARLQAEGDAALKRGDFATAAKKFEAVVDMYPSTPNIGDFVIRAGYAELYSNQYSKAVEILERMPRNLSLRFQEPALFYVAIAQFANAAAMHDRARREESENQARKAAQALRGLPHGDEKDIPWRKHEAGLGYFEGYGPKRRLTELANFLRKYPPLSYFRPTVFN